MSDAPFQLNGEVALVTGAGTGLGKAIARSLAQAGATVALVGRRREVIEQAADELNGHAFPADVTDLAVMPDLVQRVEKQLGPLTILVNNAGVHLKATALDTTDEQFACVIQTHVAASFALARTAARGMIERRRGSVVFLGSMAALFGIANVSAYSAAKGAVVALAMALASEWSPHQVRVNAISPGWIDAGMARQVLEQDPARLARVLGRTPLGRMGEPEDIGRAVVYLCSEAGRFITGSNLVIDGGASTGF